MGKRYTQPVLLFWLILNIVLIGQDLPTATSTLFSGSGNCATCHQPGAPNTSALLDGNGNDISPVTLWRSTMMANAAKDPLWQAKVTAEVTANPAYKDFIEDKCTTCHSPLGRTEAKFNGKEYYSLSEMQNDPLALDGVSCTACHQIKPDNLGTPESWSGHYIIENDRIIYGPFQNPVTTQMVMTVNYTPVFGAHTLSSDLCATCHTLFTPTVDDNGDIVGEIPEQTPYLEWRNSVYPDRNMECQTCHMPAAEGGIVISNRPTSLSPRQPFVNHYFVGANVFMLRIFKEHGAELGVTATKEQFDSTIARTMDLLQNATAELSANYRWVSSAELEVKVAVKNTSGHKFPTAYPSRRAWLKVQLNDNSGSPVFSSGSWDSATGEINNLDAPYEKHYDKITSEDQVQIYQALMHDVKGNVTYTLLKGADYIKDNRIPPVGFTSTGPFADSIKVLGLAADDPNFNIQEGVEGSGIDTVTYIISNLNSSGSYSLNVELLYQTVTPRFIEDLFQYDTPEVNKFKNYYDLADKSPVVVSTLNVDVNVTEVNDDGNVLPGTFKLYDAYPNPFNPSTKIDYRMKTPGHVTLKIYDSIGNEVAVLLNGYSSEGLHSVVFEAGGLSSGVYYVRMQSGSFSDSKKLLILK